MATCEQNNLNNEYSETIVDLATKLEQGYRYDTNYTIPRKKYLIAKRYKNLLVYLRNDVNCPNKVKEAIIEKLQLNFKL